MIGWYRKRIRKSIEHHIHEWLYHEKECAKLKPVKGMFNYRCFENAAQYASENDGVKIVLGIYIEEDGRTVLHFWNISKTGKHLETTLGFRVKALSHYPFRVLQDCELLAVGTIFDEALVYFTNKLTTRWQRFVLNGERVL